MMTNQEFILKMLNESSRSYMEIYERISDTWADLKSLHTDWYDYIKSTGDQTALDCYLDLCHALYEINEVRNHLENAYETSLEAQYSVSDVC